MKPVYWLLGLSVVFTGYSLAAEPELEEVIVIGDTVGNLGLKSDQTTGSRLGLSILETPATIEVISNEVMNARGYQRLTQAVESLPGVISGDHPAAPSTFSMRGFSRGQVSVLRDGLWNGPSSMTMRPQNTFNLERVEVLRGPSSVLNGQGAIGSTVNTIAKSAKIGSDFNSDLLLSAGSFDSQQWGVGLGGSFSESVAYRLDISDYASGGFVDRTNLESTNITGSIAWQFSNNMELKLSLDSLKDDAGQYFGTPLIPESAARKPMHSIIKTETGETIDAAMRYKNYNVEDGKAEADQLFVRADYQWNLNDNITLNSSLYRFDADREWINAEGYVYCTQVVDVCQSIGDIQRYYGYFFVFHDQEQWGNRTSLKIDNNWGDMRNRFLAGFEVMDIDFVRSRGFRRNIPPAAGDAVDPYNPVPGLYGPLELRGTSPTDIRTQAFFVEDALDITSAFSLVTALRYETMELTRQNFNAQGTAEASGFKRDYDWWSYRLGAVYKLAPDWSIYSQYSNGKDPVDANIFLVNANQNFDLTEATQWEIGSKKQIGESTEITLAYFNIKRDDITERISQDSATSIGGIDSTGFEVAITQALDQFKWGANAAYVDASFERSTNVLNNAGNTPPNVPDTSAKLWSSYTLKEFPIEVGAGYRFIDDRFGDNANRITFKSYEILDLYAAWVSGNYRFTLRADNLLNEAYVAWSDVFYLGQTDPEFIYANQVMMGAPRSYSATLQIKF